MSAPVALPTDLPAGAAELLCCAAWEERYGCNTDLVALVHDLTPAYLWYPDGARAEVEHRLLIAECRGWVERVRRGGLVADIRLTDAGWAEVAALRARVGVGHG